MLGSCKMFVRKVRIQETFPKFFQGGTQSMSQSFKNWLNKDTSLCTNTFISNKKKAKALLLLPSCYPERHNVPRKSSWRLCCAALKCIVGEVWSHCSSSTLARPCPWVSWPRWSDCCSMATQPTAHWSAALLQQHPEVALTQQLWIHLEERRRRVA